MSLKKRVWLGLTALTAYIGLPYLLVQAGNIGLLRRGRGPSTGVALTFDDGPDPATTPQVLAALREAGVRATFFMLGEQAERHPELAKQVRDEGHEVASHGFAHRHAWRRLPWALAGDLRRSRATLSRVTGQDIRFFRPPHGAYTLAGLLALRGSGLQAAHWTVEAHDWHSRYTPEDVVRRVLEHVEPGGVIVLHDAGKGGETAVAVLPGLLGELRARGYTLQTLGELEGLRPERPRDLIPRALRLLDAAFDRSVGAVRFARNANSLLRASLGGFPLEGHPRFARGTPLLELHVNSERMIQFSSKPLTGIRVTRESLRELARAMQERPEWREVQGVFAIGPFGDILSALGFETGDVPQGMQRRLGVWTGFLRRAYGAVEGGSGHEVRVATIKREELLRRYGRS